MIPQTLQAKALKEIKGRLPGKYQIPETSDIKLVVPKGGQTFQIELKD